MKWLARLGNLLFKPPVVRGDGENWEVPPVPVRPMLTYWDRPDMRNVSQPPVMRDLRD